MSVLETIGTIRNGLMWIGLWALGLCLVALLGCAISGKRHSCRFPWSRHARPSPEGSGESAASPRPSRSVLVGIALLAIVCTLFGGGKMRSGGGRGATALPGVTAEEIARGWRLESVTTNDAVSYAMPTNGVEYAPWSLGGGYEMHFPLDHGDDFGFPFGTGVVRRLDVLSGGMVESLPRQRMEGRYSSAMSICAAREYASIVPGVGRFWWADAARPESAPYQVKLLTWENVYAGRDRTGQYNAQIELCGDGNFITRSNDVERVYRRVLPYDLDNDGLPNTIDPAPETPIIPSAWNQGEAWAAAAFPSNAAEIAAMGGYAAWVAARGAEPDRRLVTFGFTFDDGSAWPTLLDFGGVPVVADGAAELAFAIDCGAKVPFSLTSGRLGSVMVTATEPPTRSGEGTTTIESHVIQKMLNFPHERSVGDIWLHLDSPRFGWLCRTANVSVEPSWLPHFFPGDSAELTASVTNCHPNAYLGCTWTGGEGIQFSDPNSLSTTVTYDPTSTVEWATNSIDLITQFVGYSLTNHVHFTVGTTNVPPLRFSLGCQEVFFLNDVEFIEGACPSNRPERIRPVTLNLTGPLGTNGTARLSVEGDVAPVLFHVINGVTNRVTSETVFPLAVTNDVSYTENYTVYMSCPKLGTGTITATFTPLGGGDSQTNSVTFRCIEPLRKLVNSRRDTAVPQIYNPSRLVYGTNAILCVDFNGPFQENEIHWHVKEGAATVNPTVGKRVVVTPTAADGVVTVEARFNDDEIQPQFVLPIVQERVLDVRAFVVCNEEAGNVEPAVDDEGVRNYVQFANFIFRQIGVRFNLLGIETLPNSAEYWNIVMNEWTGVSLWRRKSVSSQVRSLMRDNNVSGCINVYFVGNISMDVDGESRELGGCQISGGVFISNKCSDHTLAHELGHALGLWDCYDSYSSLRDQNSGLPLLEVKDPDLPISPSRFQSRPRDWGDETGRGFYALSDTYRSVIKQFLMYGDDDFIPHYSYDIPDGAVECINNNNHQKPSRGFGGIGAVNVRSTNEGVYAE